MIDVLVVGGGPVGLATAIGCALAGLSVTVAEPRAAPIDKACGEGVMPAAVRRLAALGVTPDGHPLRGIRYLDGRHQADAPFRHGNGLGVRRTALHAVLASRAAALDIPVLPTRVTAFDRDAGHVTAAGVEARYLVAADGLHSTIRRLLEGESAAVQGSAAVQRGAPARSGPWSRDPAGSRGSSRPRYGLRQHFSVAPWTDLVEVHWTAGAEAYVTPVSCGVVGIGLLFASPRHDRSQQAGAAGATAPGDTFSQDTGSRDTGSADTGRDDTRDGTGHDFESRLAIFPALLDRLSGASPVSEVRGAGPLRQDVRRRVDGRVLLVGDASGYLDALTGEGIGVGLAQAEVLARCLAAGRPADYERAWRRVSGPAWRFTAGLLWSRNQPLLGPRIVPAAQRLPWVFSTLVNHAAQA